METSAIMGHFRGIRRFKKTPRFMHHRSDGLTHRRNAGSWLQPLSGSRNRGGLR